MRSCSMADVLTLGQQQLTVLHYQVEQRSVALPSNNLFQIGTTNTSFCSETGQRKFVITPELAITEGDLAGPGVWAIGEGGRVEWIL